MYGGILGCVRREVNEGFEEGFFRGEQDVVHAVLEVLKILFFFYVEYKSCRWPYSLLFTFYLLLLSSIIRHHYALHYFNSGGLYYLIRIWFLPGGDVFFVVYKFHLILIQYLYLFFLCFLNGDNGLFPQSVILWVSEEKTPRWFLNPLFLKDNHHIICCSLLYLDRRNILLYYWMDLLLKWRYWVH